MSRSGVVIRCGFLLLAWLSIGLALLGVLTPGLPTVPFLLLASWAATRGSPRLALWLRRHPRLGPVLRDWERHGAIGTPAKLTAVAMLALGWGVLAWRFDHAVPLLLAATGFAAVALFVLTRPMPVRG